MAGVLIETELGEQREKWPFSQMNDFSWRLMWLFPVLSVS